MPKTASILFVLFLTATASWSDSYRDEIVRLIGVMQNKDYNGAIAGYKKLLQSPNLEKWQESGADADLAYLYVLTKQPDAAMSAFEQAVQLGYDDFLTLHQLPLFRSYFTNPRFRAAYAKMKISQADSAELYWLKGEIQSAIHDMSMMITENMNRKDDAFTQVPQQQIPTRKTNSVAVMVNRLVLSLIQTMQTNNVHESDVSRINHLITMGIIAHMPSGDGSSSNWSTDNTQEILESKRQADERARQRSQSIASRRFSLPAGASTTLQPCPPLGSIE